MSGLAHAAVEHALEVGAAYRQNMALRHGLEQPRAIRVTETPRQPVAQAIPLPDAAMVGRSVLGMSPAGAALAAVALASLVSGAGGWLLAGRGSAPKEETPQAAVVIEAEPAGRDDLLGYLQERGAHLPPRTP